MIGWRQAGVLAPFVGLIFVAFGGSAIAGGGLGQTRIISSFTEVELVNVVKIVGHLQGDPPLSLERINVINPPPYIRFVASGARHSPIKVTHRTSNGDGLARRNDLRFLSFSIFRKWKQHIPPDFFLNVSLKSGGEFARWRGSKIFNQKMNLP